MKKLINQPSAVVEELVEGLLLADRELTSIDGENVVVRRDYAELAKAGKVAIISGGGAGHEPAHAGYVGAGMLTAAVLGAVFTSPSVDAVLAAIRTVAGPAGVLLIIKNYTGDKLNFGLAAEIARASGIAVKEVIVGDDVALAEHGSIVGRRGIAGTVLVHKIAGAAAEAGLSLQQVHAEAEAASAGLLSMGLGLGVCTVPGSSQHGHQLAADEVEYGLGIHGESGVARGPLQAADAMVDRLVDRLLQQAQAKPGDHLALQVNNLGGTAVQELSIVARRVLQRLQQAKVVVAGVQVGTYLTALEMPGVSISVLKLDPQREQRLFAPVGPGAWTVPTRPADASPQKLALPSATQGDSQRGPAWPKGVAADRFVAAIGAVSKALLAAEPTLTELDSVVGDGDIGLSLARGAESVNKALPDLNQDDPAAALRQISGLLRRSVGGTSGPLYAMFVLRVAEAIAAVADPATLQAWAQAFRAGCDGVQQLGGGKAGDRTMLDALLPAADALESARANQQSGSAAAASALAAAEAGVEATKQMPPRLGRSSYLDAQQVLGHVDPGAYAVAVWLQAIVQALA